MTRNTSSASRTSLVTRAPRTRSAVTNGRRTHVVPVADSAWSRRFKDILFEITNDRGGADVLSEAQRQLARRAAMLSITCEQCEGKAVSGEEIDLETYGQLTDRLGRAFSRLGLKRVARDITPSLSDYLAANYGDHEDTDHDDRPSRSPIERYRRHRDRETASESPEGDSPRELPPVVEKPLPELPTPAEVLSNAEPPS